MQAGKLRQVVTIESRATAQDAAGQPATTWNHVATRRAALEASAGRELFATDQRQGRVPTLFRLRFLSGVLPSMRLLWDSKVFNILSAVDPDGRRRELLITAEQLVEETA